MTFLLDRDRFGQGLGVASSVGMSVRRRALTESGCGNRFRD